MSQFSKGSATTPVRRVRSLSPPELRALPPPFKNLFDIQIEISGFIRWHADKVFIWLLSWP
jgi:hypothetical protein